MFIPRRVFRDFFAGRLGKNLVVATLPEELRQHIVARTHEVKMEIDYARKLLVDKKLTWECLHIIQRALNEGYCIQGKTSSHLEVLYISEDNTAWILVVKASKDGTEVWFLTLFYTKRDDYYIKKFYSKQLLREQVREPFRFQH